MVIANNMNNMKMQAAIIIVEGNIASGKTTFLGQLSKKYKVMYEPVGEWMELRVKPGDESLFELYYADKAKYSFAFQMMALQTRFANLIKMRNELPGDSVIICERSIFTDYEIFAKMAHADGFISDIEFEVYKSWFKLITGFASDIAGTIYLRAPPETCMARALKRARPGEDVLNVEFLTKVHDAHERWLSDNAIDDCVLVIDANIEATDFESAGVYDQVATYIQSRSSPWSRKC